MTNTLSSVSPADGYAGDVTPQQAWQWVQAGQAVLVARFVGAGDVDRVNKTVQQALLTAIAIRLESRGPVLYLPTDTDRPRWNALPGEIAKGNEQVAVLQAARVAVNA